MGVPLSKRDVQIRIWLLLRSSSARISWMQRRRPTGSKTRLPLYQTNKFNYNVGGLLVWAMGQIYVGIIFEVISTARGEKMNGSQQMCKKNMKKQWKNFYLKLPKIELLRSRKIRKSYFVIFTGQHNPLVQTSIQKSIREEPSIIWLILLLWCYIHINWTHIHWFVSLRWIIETMSSIYFYERISGNQHPL